MVLLYTVLTSVFEAFFKTLKCLVFNENLYI